MNPICLRKVKQPNPYSINTSSLIWRSEVSGGQKYWKVTHRISNLGWKLRPASCSSLNRSHWRSNQPDCCCSFPLAPHHRNVAICEKPIEVESKWLLGKDTSITGSVLQKCVTLHTRHRFSSSTSLSLHLRLPLKMGAVFENHREK